MSNSPDRLAEALKDRYTLERELGAGGMALVHIAHHLLHRAATLSQVARHPLA